MQLKKAARSFYNYLKKDTWHSFLVSVILIVVSIKFILFPTLSLITGTPLPLVVVESCSMYHASSFDSWWDQNAAWYESQDIEKIEFAQFPLKNGLDKGDIVFVWGYGEYSAGDIIIFVANTKYPIIHRMISDDPIATKGDNNNDQLEIEMNIPQQAILGKAVGKIPLVGWIKLILFEPFKNPAARGLCR